MSKSSLQLTFTVTQVNNEYFVLTYHNKISQELTAYEMLGLVAKLLHDNLYCDIWLRENFRQLEIF